MKIVYATPRIPYPPNRGDRIRSYAHLRHLARRHELHLVCLGERREDWDGVAEMRRLCASVSILPLSRLAGAMRVTLSIVSGGPLVAAYLAAPRLRRAVLAAAGDDTDVLWICNGALAPVLSGVRARHRVVDFVDVDSDKWRQMALASHQLLAAIHRREARLTRALEELNLRQADRCLVISETEAALLRSLQPGVPGPTVVPAAIDLDEWPAVPLTSEPRVLFTGTLDYAPNEDAVRFFASEVLPRLRRLVPHCRMTAVGARPTRRLRRDATRLDFELASDVDDVRPYLAGARVAIAPLRFARGTQNKVIEAMASGVPVVATPAALAGLAAGGEEVALRAESPDALALACFELISDDRLARQIAERGHHFVAAHHSFACVASALDRLLDDLAATRDSKGRHASHPRSAGRTAACVPA